jgi:hypothetical protein
MRRTVVGEVERDRRKGGKGKRIFYRREQRKWRVKTERKFGQD